MNTNVKDLCKTAKRIGCDVFNFIIRMVGIVLITICCIVMCPFLAIEYMYAYTSPVKSLKQFMKIFAKVFEK